MKRACLSMCVLALLLAMLSPCAFAENAQTGKLGDNITYIFFRDKGLVVVSGEGEMWDFDPDNTSIPELEWREGESYPFDFSGRVSPLVGNSDVRYVEIGDGITRIGACVFYHCHITTLTLGEDVREIGRLAFAGNALSSVQFPKSLKKLEEFCFFTQGGINTACFLGDAPDFGWDDEAVWSPFFNDDPKEGKLVLYFSPDAEGWPMEMKINREYPQIPMRFMDIPVDQPDLFGCLNKSNWLEGVEKGRFAPNATATRAQLVMALFRMCGNAAGSAQPSRFQDVDEGLWYSDAVRWAATRGIVTGYPDGTFRPDQELSTQDLALILYRCSGKTKYASENAKSGDRISAYARGAVVWMKEWQMNSTENFPQIWFGPEETITRADMARILLLFSDII